MYLTTLEIDMSITWNNKKNWLKSAHNTKWCLIGCAIGDFSTIAYFQHTEHSLSTLQVMIFAMINGLLSSIILETIILYRAKFSFVDASKNGLWYELYFHASHGDSNEHYRLCSNGWRHINLGRYAFITHCRLFNAVAL